MKPKQSPLWNKLRLRLRRATAGRGQKVRLAARFGVSPQSVTEWLSGQSSPTADKTLELLQWVEGEERKQKTPGSAINTTRGRRTRKLQSLSHEKSKRIPQGK